jgi:hypothetical protein
VTSVNDRRAAVLAVVRGLPTDTELAAVISVLLTARGAGVAETAAAPARVSRWPGRSFQARLPLPPHGLSSWRASALPR